MNFLGTWQIFENRSKKVRRARMFQFSAVVAFVIKEC